MKNQVLTNSQNLRRFIHFRISQLAKKDHKYQSYKQAYDL